MIAVDAYDEETLETVAGFAGKQKLTHPILLGGGEVSDRYGIEKVLPTSFWIDHHGKVVKRETGFLPEMEKEKERMIEALLGARDAEAKRAPSQAGPR